MNLYYFWKNMNKSNKYELNRFKTFFLLIAMKAIVNLSFGQETNPVPSFVDVECENLSLFYQQNSGQFQGEAFHFKTHQLDIELKKDELAFIKKITENTFHVLLPTEEFLIKNVPSLINTIDQIQFNGLEISYLSQKDRQFELQKLQSINPHFNLDVNTLKIWCQPNTRNLGAPYDLIDGCLHKATFAVVEGHYQELEPLHFPLAPPRSFNQVNVKIKDLKGVMTDHHFQIKFKATSGVTVNINIQGSAHLDPSDQFLIIQITKIKAGIIDVTHQFFDFLSQQDIKNVKVARPYIYIYINQMLSP